MKYFGTLIVAFYMLGACNFSTPKKSGIKESTLKLANSNPWYSDNVELDSDGDGISDFWEMNKYFSDPLKKDHFTNSKRDKTYSINQRLEVLKPFNLDAMNNDHQDATLVSENTFSAIVDVTVYPLAKSTNGLKGNKDWKVQSASMQRWLQPGLTTNWDEEMRKDIVAQLKLRNVDIGTIDDISLVNEIALWLMDPTQFQFKDFFISYDVLFDQGKPVVNPKLGPYIDLEMKKNGLTDKESALRLGVLGREMYNARFRGHCTASSTLFATVLKAVGIPTRFVLTVPAVDGNSAEQLAMLDKGITHNIFRQKILNAQPKQGFASHTFVEVYVGGRWVRLNYNNFGQSALWSSMGLLTQVSSFADWGEAGNLKTWGEYAQVDYFDPSVHSKLSSQNPYRVLKIQDHFGISSGIENIVPAQFKELEIKRVLLASSSSLLAPYKPLFKGKVLFEIEYDDKGLDIGSSLNQFIYNLGTKTLTIRGNDETQVTADLITISAPDHPSLKGPDGFAIDIGNLLKKGVKYKVDSIDTGKGYRLLFPADLEFEISDADK
jgi:hypothetical protein